MLSAGAPKVLLVDDDESLLIATKRLLSSSEPEWQILTASDGEEALELMKEHEFAVVITDLDMPRTDGSAVLRHAAEYHPGTIRIVHSSHPAMNGEVNRMPAHRVVAKPAAPAHLLTIARWGVRQSATLARAVRSLLA